MINRQKVYEKYNGGQKMSKKFIQLTIHVSDKNEIISINSDYCGEFTTDIYRAVLVEAIKKLDESEESK